MYEEQAKRLEELNIKINDLNDEKMKLIHDLAKDPNFQNWASDRMANYNIFNTNSLDELAETIQYPSGEPIQYPLELSGIDIRDEPFLRPIKSYFVDIRPVDDKKTYLGFYIGDLATSISLNYNKKSKVFQIGKGMYNPAIYVFELKRIVMGYESWWGKCKDQEKAKLDFILGNPIEQISDADIQNVPYVKALQYLKEGDKDKFVDMVYECILNEANKEDVNDQTSNNHSESH